MNPDFTEEDLRIALKRAFQRTTPGKNPFIVFGVPELRNPFLREGWYLGIRQGWLETQEVNLEQETYFKGFLTPKGKQELAL